MFTHIVTAVDGSDITDRVLAVACDMAKAEGIKLTLVHVPQSETTTLAIGAIAGMHAAMAMPTTEQIEKAGHEVLNHAKGIAARTGCPEIDTVLRQGEAADVIVEIAEEIGADLIITGRRGLGGLTSLVLGSTSQRIGHLAKCSCMTVV